MNKEQNFLIVGGGLAGLTLAKFLSDESKNVTLIDKNKNQCSRISVGMINPLVFRRMTKSWRVDEFLPFANEFYLDIEKVCKLKLYHPIKTRRFFASQQEKDFWLSKEQLDDFTPYMEKVSEEDLTYQYGKIKNDHGSGLVKNCAWLDVQRYADVMYKILSTKIKIIEETFDYDQFNASEGVYQNKKYTHIIFCTGYEAINDPYFPKERINPTRGQLLIIKSNDIKEHESINRKCFVLPLGDNLFKIGSTYEWQTPNDEITETAKNEILENLKALGEFDLEVVEHTAGIRPTVLDRRPIIGQHPTLNKLYIFNGLGAKGIMIAPLLAKEFVDFMLHGKALDKEVDVKRFMKN